MDNEIFRISTPSAIFSGVLGLGGTIDPQAAPIPAHLVSISFLLFAIFPP